MRNLKKILALALVFAMAFTFTAGAASFTDAADIGTNYVDDVNMLVELGVLAGYPDGSFGPAKNITRAEFAKMAYTLKYGSDADGDLFAAQASKFTDVQGNANVAWAKGYINYCANQNIVSGVGNNKFNPQGNITVAEAAKMILVILGCDPAKEGFTGANWMSNVVAKAIDLGVFNGWAGDPSALATRELVAKLMRNAIFSPIYTYSAITGTGSQVNALGTAFNKTLGETTMGLYHVEGIVVANEKNAINTDEEGEALKDVTARATNDDEESVIYYTQTISGVKHGRLLPIDRGLSDEMLGNKVDVYFKVDDIDRDATTGEIKGYYNPEVIGNVLVNSDTVVYNVASSEIKVYPDGKSTSTAQIRPYITFADANGDAVTITTPSTVNRLAKSANAKADAAVTAYFAQFAYINDSARALNDNIYATVAEQIDAAVAAEIADDVTTWKSNNPGYTAEDLAAEIERLSAIELPVQTSAANVAFMADMAANTLAQYRFVSVDGGKTYSYIFKTEETAITNSYVTAYSESKGSITISNIGNKALDEVILKGDIAVDDMVVCYSVDSKLVVEKVEPFTGSVESFNDEGTAAIINGKAYTGLNGGDYTVKNTKANEGLVDFYMSRPEAMTNSTYYAYNNIVLRLDTEAQAVAASNYAVILNIAPNAYGEPSVVLGFADGTSKRYDVADKYYKMKDALNTTDDSAANLLAAARGGLVKYKDLGNGTVDLSAQSFQAGLSGKDADYMYDVNSASGITKGAISGNRYPESNDSVVFVIYGDDTTTLVPKFAVYKISDIESLTPAATVGLNTNFSNTDVIYDSDAATKRVVVAAMTIATNASGEFLGFTSNDETATFAYVVKAIQYKDIAADKYYAELTLINEDGLFTVKTVNDVQNYDNQSFLADDVIGVISDNRDATRRNLECLAGNFVVYEKNNEGLIDRLDGATLNGNINGGNIKVAVYDKEPKLDPVTGLPVVPAETLAPQGFYLVNVISEGDGRITFYDSYGSLTDLTDSTPEAVYAKKYDKDGHKIVTISEDDYVGSSLITLAANAEELEARSGNAIIYVNTDGEVEYVYSFVDAISK